MRPAPRALVLATLLAACALAPPEPAYTDDLVRLCEPLAHVICDRAARCGGCSAIEGVPFDVAACETNERAVCIAGLRATSTSDQRVILARADACIEAQMRVDTCGEIVACQGVLAAPARPVDDPSCPELASCDDGAGICVDAACIRLPIQSEPCAIGDGICAPGLVCGFAELGGMQCALPVPLGGSCSATGVPCALPARCVDGVCALSVREGGACRDLDACEAGLACVQGRCVTPSPACDALSCGRAAVCMRPTTCQPPLALGDACEQATDCGASAWCIDGVCALRSAIGASCASVPCGPDAFCDGRTASCTPRVARGGACSTFASGDRSECAQGLACVSDTCAPPPPVGAPCSDEGLCARGAACSRISGLCIAAEGGLCNIDGDCASDRVCDATNRCVALPIGRRCTPGITGCRCLADASGLPVCQPPPTRGAPCDETAHCPAGLVCRGTGALRCVPGLCLELRM